MPKGEMKLSDLDPRWASSGGEGITRDGQPVPRRERIGLICNCPKCGEDHPLFVPFANPPDGEPPVYPANAVWHRTGDVLETLTLTPSILRKDCGWHGFITNGEILTC